MAFVLLISASTSAHDFGVFSVLYALFILMLGGARSFITEPLLFGRANVDGWDNTGIRGAVLGAASIVAVAFALVYVVFGLVMSAGNMRLTAFILALAVPVVMAQDCLRYFAMWQREGSRLLKLDVVWAMVQFGPSFLFLSMGWLNAASICAFWGLGALVSMILGMIQIRAVPSLTSGGMWLNRQKRVGSAMLSEFASGQGSLQVCLMLIALTAGPVVTAAVRITQVAVGTVNVLVQGAQGFIVPRLNESSRSPRNLLLGSSAGLALTTGTIAMALFVMPHDLARTVFGTSWTLVTVPILLIISMDRLLAASAAPLAWYLRTMGQLRTLVLCRALAGASLVLCGTLGAYLRGAMGASFGIATGAIISAVWIVIRALSVMRKQYDDVVVLSHGAFSPRNIRYYGYFRTLSTPFLATVYMRLSRTLRRERVRSATGLLVDGFPRSANSYIREALSRRSAGMQVSSHLHSPVAVRRAVKLGIPVIVLVRHPMDAAASLVQLLPGLSPGTALRIYVEYYRGLRGVKEKIVLAEFATVVTDLASVLAACNKKFHICLDTDSVDSSETRQIWDELDRQARSFPHNREPVVASARPHPDRAPAREIFFNAPPGVTKRLEQAMSLYHEFSAEAV